MARIRDKEKAIRLRKQGKSYSEIKKEINVSKSTLSAWLRDYPLSKKDIVRLRDKNPIRIEKCRETKRIKREKRLDNVYKKISKDISILSDREIFLSGLFLYWAEGTKTTRYTTAIANTDPAIIIFFLKWLSLLNVPKNKINIRLQLYSDMDIKNEVRWWSGKINLKPNVFKKAYIKKTKLADVTYKGAHGHGTCNVLVYGRDITEYILMGIRYLQDINTN